MFERIVAPPSREPVAATPPVLASVVFHLVVVLAVGGAVAHVARDTGVDLADERAMLLFPLLPSSAPPQATVLEWAGGTSPGEGRLEPRAGTGRGQGVDQGTGRQTGRVVPGAEAGPEEGGGAEPVYAFDAELDRPVARSPFAGAPAYPPHLLAERVEGHVIAEFTVDEHGSADSASLVIAEATHPDFARALREAMPRLRFLPAQHRGRGVSQRVQQKYIFRVEITDTVRATT